MRLSDLKRLFEKTARNAGPRYTPHLEPGAPNLHIEELVNSIDCLILHPRARGRVRALREDLLTAFTAATTVRRNWGKRFKRPNGILEDLQALAASGPEGTGALRSQVSAKLESHRRTLDRLHDDMLARESLRARSLSKLPNDELRQDKELRGLRDQLSEIRSYLSALYDIARFLASNEGELLEQSNCLLTGPWGSGKTHFLCDLTSQLLNEGVPSLCLLAKDLDPAVPIATSITAGAGLTPDFARLLSGLNRLGKQKRQRALLIVDGINEQNINSWRMQLGDLIDAVEAEAYVGLIISCRSPFERSVVNEANDRRLTTIHHPGFTGLEHVAQAEFFSHYNIAVPDVPLLAEEFSRPLTLKILCGAFRGLSAKAQASGFSGLSSGQKGMTYIFESFTKARGDVVESRFGLAKLTCWKIVKGGFRNTDGSPLGFAPAMVASFEDYLKRDEAIAITSACVGGVDQGLAEEIYLAMVSEGLLQEERRWLGGDDHEFETITRLPYQRFSDHVIARHILDKHIDWSDVTTVKRSLRKDRLAGRVFSSPQQGQGTYLRESWAEALILEFPERLKRLRPEGPRELLAFLPKQRRDLRAYLPIFISGLYWRSPSSIDKASKQLVTIVVNSKSRVLQAQLFEALVALATKSKHPFQASYLANEIGRLSLRDRDLSWSEFLRIGSNQGVVDRVLKWLESDAQPALNHQTKKNIMLLLSLFLTSTDRHLRDRVTRLLVVMGESDVDALFDVTRAQLTFNDPYVSERLLASSYGVSMSLWGDPNNKRFQDAIVPFAKALVRDYFCPSGSYSTTHSLCLDYALSVVELAQLCKPRCIATKYIKFLRKPFLGIRSSFPEVIKLSKKANKRASTAIHMDFGNYTLGTLCPSRGNYDFESLQYKEARQRIEWRILDLGYDPDAFQQADEFIGRSSFGRQSSRGWQVDRYGKKYSWIAFFELHGELKRTGGLEDGYPEARPSQIDIDPSFTRSPEAFAGVRSTVLRTGPKSAKDWILSGGSPTHRNYKRQRVVAGEQGDWVLLYGFFSETAEDKRSYYSFVRGLLVAEDELPKLKSLYKRSVEGIDGSSLEATEHLTFFGEVSWSKKFAFHRRDDRGKLTDGAVEVYSEHKRRTVAEAVPRGWQVLFDTLRDEWDELRNNLNSSVRFLHPCADDLERFLVVVPEVNAGLPSKEQVTFNQFMLHIPSKEEIELGYRYTFETYEIPGVQVKPAYCSLSSPADETFEDQCSNFVCPCPELSIAGGLSSQRRSPDLRDLSGVKGSLYRVIPNQSGADSQLCFIRKDILDDYLKANSSELVWLTSGEREIAGDFTSVRDDRSDGLLAAIQSGSGRYRLLDNY